MLELDYKGWSPYTYNNGRLEAYDSCIHWWCSEWEEVLDFAEVDRVLDPIWGLSSKMLNELTIGGNMMVEWLDDLVDSLGDDVMQIGFCILWLGGCAIYNYLIVQSSYLCFKNCIVTDVIEINWLLVKVDKQDYYNELGEFIGQEGVVGALMSFNELFIV